MATNLHREPWNKGIIVGQKAPLKLREVWAIRMRLQLAHRARELALFNLGVDSKLRACDLLQLRVRDICHGDRVANRAIVMQQKTHRPVQFEITEPTREALAAWIKTSALHSIDWLFAGRKDAAHLSTRQYSRIVHRWIVELGVDASAYGTHSIRRTKASLIYRRTKDRVPGRGVRVVSLGSVGLVLSWRRPTSERSDCPRATAVLQAACSDAAVAIRRSARAVAHRRAV
jgi:integrase